MAITNKQTPKETAQSKQNLKGSIYKQSVNQTDNQA